METISEAPECDTGSAAKEFSYQNRKHDSIPIVEIQFPTISRTVEKKGRRVPVRDGPFARYIDQIPIDPWADYFIHCARGLVGSRSLSSDNNCGLSLVTIPTDPRMKLIHTLYLFWGLQNTFNHHFKRRKIFVWQDTKNQIDLDTPWVFLYALLESIWRILEGAEFYFDTSMERGNSRTF